MSDSIAVAVENESDGLLKQNRANTRGAIHRYRDWVMGTLFFVLLVLGYAAFRAGSVGRALPYLIGQRVFVEPVINLGAVRCGDEVNVKVHVVNSGSGSVTVVGARKSCGCIGIEAFPVEVQAGCNYPLQLKFRVPESETKFVYSVELYIAEEGQNFLPFSIALSGVATE